MKEQIEAYINGLFADATLTIRNAELRQEILQHTLDRYDDLLASGLGEQDAYEQAVAGIGDISDLYEHVPQPKTETRDFPAPPMAQPSGTSGASAKPRGKKQRRFPIWARIVVGLAVLVLVLNFAGGFAQFNGYRYDDAAQYQLLPRSGFGTGADSVFEDITDIEVHWLSGSVTVTSTLNETVYVQEDYTGENEDYRLYYRVDGSKLIIQPCRSSSWWSLFRKGGLNLPSKALNLSIPQSLRELEIVTVSADVNLHCDGVPQIEVETTSGKLYGANVTAEELEVKSVSGAVDLYAVQVQSIELNTVSGKMEVNCASVPQEVQLESVSGDLILSLPKGAHCDTTLDSTSGDVVTKDYTFGDKARCIITAHTVSGNVFLQDA